MEQTTCHNHACCHDDEKGEMTLGRIGIAACIFAIGLVLHVGRFTPITDSLVFEYVIFLIPYFMVGWPVLVSAAKGVIRGKLLDEAFLMALATIAAAIGELPEAVAVMLFYQVGEWFQDRAVDTSRDAISALVDIKADYANIERDGVVERVDPAGIEVGDTIIVNAGERIPLDGVVREGQSDLDTSALTGESAPVSVGAGTEVLAGCINGSGVLRIGVTRLFSDSAVARILDMVNNAASKKARTETFIRRFAHIYTPIVVIAAAVFAIVPPLVIGPGDPAIWADYIERACVFLVISCPCALVISVPLSFYCGIGALSKLGVLVKGGNYLEQLARVETVVFDKTGTLTQGTFHVTEVHPVQGISQHHLLEVAAHVEQSSSHPIAQSVYNAYMDRHDTAPTLGLPDHHDVVEEVPGQGLVVICEAGRICAGNDKLMAREGIVSFPCDEVGTFIHISLDGVYQGHLVIADEVKSQAAAAIAKLKAIGVRSTVMLTGDRQDVAQNIASRLGVDRFYAQLLPNDKVEHVEELINARDATSKSTLAFVGDGINDAPVLMRADVGIAMGAMGSDAAIEAADIVLMDDNPVRIADAVRVARKTVWNARQNVTMAIVVKALVFVLGFLGYATMWMAVFADTGIAMLCVLNAMRLLRQR